MLDLGVEVGFLSRHSALCAIITSSTWKKPLYPFFSPSLLLAALTLQGNNDQTT